MRFRNASRTTTIKPAAPEPPTLEMMVLERAVKYKEYYLLLLHILPTQEAENRLRLLKALLDFKMYIVDDEPNEIIARQAKARKITAMFFQSGCTYEVRGLPSHLLKDLEESCDLIKHMILQDLVKLEEVVEALNGKETLDYEQEKIDNDDQNLALSQKEYSMRGQYGNLAVIGQLETLIGNQKLKRELIHAIITSSQMESGLSTNIRFVSAVDQFMNCDNEIERLKLGSKICSIFCQTNGSGIFKLQFPQVALQTMTRHGNFDCLELVRLEILKELSVNADMVAIVTEMITRHRLHYT